MGPLHHKGIRVQDLQVELAAINVMRAEEYIYISATVERSARAP